MSSYTVFVCFHQGNKIGEGSQSALRFLLPGKRYLLTRHRETDFGVRAESTFSIRCYGFRFFGDLSVLAASIWTRRARPVCEFLQAATASGVPVTIN